MGAACTWSDLSKVQNNWERNEKLYQKFSAALGTREMGRRSRRILITAHGARNSGGGCWLTYTYTPVIYRLWPHTHIALNYRQTRHVRLSSNLLLEHSFASVFLL